MRFPKDFIWGAATSAIQIEGSPLSDGGGESVWDTFCRKEGTIAFGDNADIACDSYHRFPEDISILKELGLRHYRFSTSWARIDPKGDGNWNRMGLAYYDRLVNCCLENEITPWLTLHHWELPQALEDDGGWLNRRTAEAFERFAAMMAEHFRGRVSHYITLNEPECILGLGYGQGIHAPGHRYDLERLFACWKNLMLAHGLAGRAIRSADPHAQIGLVSTGRLCYPKTPEDEEAARQETFALYDDDWTFTHNLVMDPACFGSLNTTPGTQLHTLAGSVTPEEWQIMHFPPDFVGMNVYNGNEVISAAERADRYLVRYPGFPRTALKWPVTPQIMGDSLRYVQQRYHRPIIITECGLSCCDWVHMDGKVHDADRIDFLHRYLKELRDHAEETGVRGFFQWSLLDNFEWHSGYTERFGIVYVDYSTGIRTLKDSALWYARTAETNGDAL